MTFNVINCFINLPEVYAVPIHDVSTVADVLVTTFSAFSWSRGNFIVTKGGTACHVSCGRFYCFSESARRAQLFCIQSRKTLWNATWVKWRSTWGRSFRLTRDNWTSTAIHKYISWRNFIPFAGSGNRDYVETKSCYLRIFKGFVQMGVTCKPPFWENCEKLCTMTGCFCHQCSVQEYANKRK
jgi:hypothetical protein